MDNLLTDGLCSVGLLYLMLHLWQSISTIGQGVRQSRVPTQEADSEHREAESVLSRKATEERGSQL